MKVFIFVTLVLFVHLFHINVCLQMKPKGVCECAAFNSKEFSSSIKPILQQKPMNVTCDEEGSAVCKKMCTALAIAARARGPALLCASVLNIYDLVVSVYSRSCNEDQWVYTNLTSTDPICCRDGEPILCEGAEVIITKN